MMKTHLHTRPHFSKYSFTPNLLVLFKCIPIVDTMYFEYESHFDIIYTYINNKHYTFTQLIAQFIIYIYRKLG